LEVAGTWLLTSRKSRAIATSIQKLRGAVEELEGSQGGDAMDVDGDNQNEIKTPA